MVSGLCRRGLDKRVLDPFLRPFLRVGEEVSLYRIFYFIGRLFFPLLVDIRITGSEHIPRSGPVLLVSNHRSYTDPVVLSAACPRRIHYLAKSELFGYSRVFKRLIGVLGAVPIRRHGYAGSTIRRAGELLAEGKVVGMFPEGGIKTPGQLKPGVALIAARTDAPIVAVYLRGTRGMYEPEAYLLRARKVRVDVGKPFHSLDVGDPSDRARFAERLLARLRKHIVRGGDTHANAAADRQD